MRSGRRVQIDGYGDADRLVVVPQRLPEPAHDEVVVEVVSAGLSHMDAYVAQGRFSDELPMRFPTGLGVSFAGIVKAVGHSVKSVRRGAEVLGHDPAHSAYADAVSVPAGALVRKPQTLTWEVAGGLYLPGATAFTTVQNLSLHAGDVVVITAAAGGVGHLECQLARLAGATVLGVAGLDNQDYLRSIGVVPIVHGDGVDAQITAAAGGRPVTAFIDNFGTYEALAHSLGVAPGRFVSTDARRETELHYYGAPADDATAAIVLADVAELVSTWGIRPIVSGFYGFDDIGRAFTNLDRRHSRGLVVVGMHTSAPSKSYRAGTARANYEAQDALGAGAASARVSVPALGPGGDA